MRVYVYTLACWFEIALRSQSASLGSVLNDIKGCKRAGIISACQWQNDDKSKKLFQACFIAVIPLYERQFCFGEADFY